MSNRMEAFAEFLSRGRELRKFEGIKNVKSLDELKKSPDLVLLGERDYGGIFVKKDSLAYVSIAGGELRSLHKGKPYFNTNRDMIFVPDYSVEQRKFTFVRNGGSGITISQEMIDEGKVLQITM